ncbi:glycosyltransferase family 4 protein [Raineya orbicola]|uniref:Glycosyl transferase group 1 n=1 Tax=Raineya orbicola TaxID=2016530 RepID=A0A2N3I6T2_9BACT|nr:glycosyltransferase family 4 protein [Raineya orbicola]PKQ66034.1 Glycosyl transferase group 1 [Raineya orbicola]
MKIIYLHQYFKLPTENGSHRSWYIAQFLQKKGWEVEIITASKKARLLFSDNLKIHYVSVSYAQEMHFLRRTIAFLNFLIKAIHKILKIPNISLIYATSTPLTIGLIALILKKIKKVPYVFEVRDLWPLVPIEMGYVKSKIFQRFLFWLEKKIYQNAEKIVVLSPPMEEYVRRIVPEKPILCVPNMSDCEIFFPQNKKKENEPFRIAYFGSMGKANALERLLQVAEKHPEIEFWIIGEGSEKKKLQQIASQKVYFFAGKPKHELNEMLAYADAFYVSFAEYPSLETCSPNKFFDGIAAGKLCITNTKGWVKDLIEKYECGFYADSPDEFKEKIQPFLQDKSLLQTYQNNARHLAEKVFNKEILCSKIVDFISA